MRVPRTRVTTVAVTATKTEERAPKTSLAATSRPTLSVPNKYAADGASSTASPLACGSCTNRKLPHPINSKTSAQNNTPTNSVVSDAIMLLAVAMAANSRCRRRDRI
jgi:hypothetical protein